MSIFQEIKIPDGDVVEHIVTKAEDKILTQSLTKKKTKKRIAPTRICNAPDNSIVDSPSTDVHIDVKISSDLDGKARRKNLVHASASVFAEFLKKASPNG